MFTWNMVFSIAVVAIIMWVGEVVSGKTGGKVPQMFLVAAVFLVGFWTVLPTDIIEVSGLKTVSDICQLIILITVGAMFDVKSILKDWRVVVTTLAAIVGILALVLTVGMLIFGKQTALVAASPLAGGGMAALVMQSATEAIGKPELGMLAIMIFILQGFVGFPATAYFLRKEGNRLVAQFRKDPSIYHPAGQQKEQAGDGKRKKAPYELVPENLRTPTFYLMSLFVLSAISYGVYLLLGGAVDKSVIHIITGIIGGSCGLIPRNAMNVSQSSGILTFALFASFMATFATATPQLVLQLLVMIVVMMALSTLGILLLSIPVGKKLGYSTYMSAAIGLNCFLGFPYNYSLTNEAVRVVAKTPEEAAYLTDEMMPKMIIGSVVAVSVVSTMLAGILVNFL